MEIELTVNGKKVTAHVDEDQLKTAMKKPKKKTGYEHRNSGYYYVYTNGEVRYAGGPIAGVGEEEHKCGNMYTDKLVAVNNARADELMRNLRRFSAEHGGCGSIGAFKKGQYMWCIVYCSENEKPIYAAERLTDCAEFGNIYFCNKEAAENAIDEFYDELMWYFTEYDPMPEGWWGNDC